VSVCFSVVPQHMSKDGREPQSQDWRKRGESARFRGSSVDRQFVGRVSFIMTHAALMR
jgi:hypothetical protein